MSIDMKSEASAIPTGTSTIDKRGDRTDYSTQKIGERPREIVPGTEKPTRGERLQDWAERMKADKMARRQFFERAVATASVAIPTIAALAIGPDRLAKGAKLRATGQEPSRNPTQTDTAENLTFEGMDPQVLVESQEAANFSEITRHGYTFRKLDGEGNLETSATPAIYLVNLDPLPNLTGNWELDGVHSIDAYRFRRGQPNLQSDSLLVLETNLPNNKQRPAVPIVGEEFEGSDVWWIVVGGEEINGVPVVHAVDPSGKKIPKAENNAPYLFHNNFIDKSSPLRGPSVT